MSAFAFIIAAILLLAVVLVAIGIFTRTFLRLRGERVVSCPETDESAAVDVDNRYAALTAIRGKPELRLKDCSRWPERENCGQECLRQIERAPEECLVRTMLATWYLDKTCFYCGKKFGEIHWMDNKPALMSLERRIREWEDIPPEKLPETLETHLPVCFDCNVAETFRRMYPDLVTDRPPGPDDNK